jgi:hypothetical protein
LQVESAGETTIVIRPRRSPDGAFVALVASMGRTRNRCTGIASMTNRSRPAQCRA